MRDADWRRRRAAWRTLAVLALIGQVFWHGWDLFPPGLLDRSGRLKAPDFLQFYTFGSLVASGHIGQIYDGNAHAAAAREIHPQLTLTHFTPNYSPFVALLMTPLAWLPFGHAMAVFSTLSLVLYALGTRLLLTVTTTLRSVPLDVTLLAAAWPALFMTLRYGQMSALTLGLFATAAACHLRGTPLAAGAALGLVVYKPNLLLAPALTLLFAREWRLLAGLAIGAGLELGIGACVAGPASMKAYADVLVDLAVNPALVQMFGTEQHSLRGLLQMWGFQGLALGLTTWLAVPIAAIASSHVWRRTRDHRMNWSALTLAALLVSPHLLTYDLLLLAVPLVLLVDWLLEQTDSVRRSGWRLALWLLYLGAWPGTLLARIYGVQISTIGMLFGLALALRYSVGRVQGLPGEELRRDQFAAGAATETSSGTK